MSDSLSDIQEIINKAIHKKGKLISIIYVNSQQPLIWECSNKHRWEACWSSIKHSNSWCPTCAKQTKPDIQVLIEYAKNKRGKLLTAEYKNNLTPMLWECASGHKWEACWANISRSNKSATWCPVCAKNIKNTIETLNQFAINKGGKLLSKEYKNTHSKLEWQCSKEHTWFAQWSDILTKQSWCPYCKKCKTEYECKQLFELITNKPFIRIRLIPFNNTKLELDGYNEELKIAFEYNGIQHYKFFPLFHKNKETFEYQKTKDNYKKQWCKDNNIVLISIPYTEKSNLKQYIERELQNVLCNKKAYAGLRSQKSI